MQTIDVELFDRQIRTFGKEATIKLNSSSVGIIGLQKGLGTEIAKNLSLCGIRELFFIDDNLITEEDLVTGYYYSDKDIGKKRCEVLASKIQTEVTITKEFLGNVIISINQSLDFDIKLNEYCRSNNKKFIRVQSSNNVGIIFVDAGLNHLVTNLTGENYEPIQIISMENNVIITNGHDYQTGDTIRLSNLQGENVKELEKEFTIEVINRFKFSLKDFNNNNIKLLNGTSHYVDKSIYINHNDLKSEIQNADNYIHSDIEIIAVNSIIGSIAASEALKLISNKYQPISQWFKWIDEDLDINKAKDKLIDSEFFIVGSGAIGCELLKNLAFLNIKKIIVTDPDIIEKSNLSRQFLFRQDDIGKHKSEIASKCIKEMKPQLEIEYMFEKVSNENLTFTNNILSSKSLTGVFNALDNIEARKFMDNQCYNFDKPLFESGTLGIKGNTQPVIPYLTETYSNSNDPVVEKSFAVCTIKHFPNEIHHTIHWALDQFEFFNKKTGDINTNNLESCVNYARQLFDENYKNQIVKLLNEFPENSLNSEGKPFWSAGKRCPKPIQFDINNVLHFEYIKSTIILLCKSVGINYDLNDETLKIIINDYDSNRVSDFKVIYPQEFNKDDDNNYHVSFVTSASNLRAHNYGIEPADFYTTKGIAGRIIPAVATTTSIVSGLITIEMIKYLYCTDISNFKSTFINLALNTYISAEPMPAKMIEINGQKINSWIKFVINENITLEKFIEKYNDIFKTKITIISLGSSLIYADFLSDENLSKTLSEIIKENESEERIFTLGTDDENETLPDIKFNTSL
jgi:ubiquitin-activating enzyme E1